MLQVWIRLKLNHNLLKEINKMLYIGTLRKFLLMPFNCKYNAFIRDITAKYEGSFLIRSSVN